MGATSADASIGDVMKASRCVRTARMLERAATITGRCRGVEGRSARARFGQLWIEAWARSRRSRRSRSLVRLRKRFSLARMMLISHSQVIRIWPDLCHETHTVFSCTGAEKDSQCTISSLGRSRSPVVMVDTIRNASISVGSMAVGSSPDVVRTFHQVHDLHLRRQPSNTT